jgi:hypothetical protein
MHIFYDPPPEKQNVEEAALFQPDPEPEPPEMYGSGNWWRDCLRLMKPQECIVIRSLE